MTAPTDGLDLQAPVALTRVPPPSFAHVLRMSDAGGLFEHADRTAPRRAHGYCVDDVARGLVVLDREPLLTPELASLREAYLAFVLDAQAGDGRFTNRRACDLRWTGRPEAGDCWGRALWGLGSAVAHPGRPGSRDRVLAAFDTSVALRSHHPRAAAHAVLGAAEVVGVLPGHAGALALLSDVLPVLRGTPEHATADTTPRTRSPATDGWLWPEPRLSWGNALVPDALMAAGSALGEPAAVELGLRRLDWLLRLQTHDGHLSVVPVGGWGPGDRPPGFDQQPVEVATLADACARAHALTGEDRWRRGVELAVSWFLGDNDIGVPLVDPGTGGGCDGLHADRRNENQGAESTLALVSTLQHARALLPGLTAVPVPVPT